MTLTETAIFTKRFLIFSAIFITVLLIVWVGSIYSKNYFYSKVPQITEKPDLKFALLPKLKFLQANATSSNYSYSLDTPTGALPEKLPTVFKIYAIPALGNTFLATDKAKGLAEKFAFIGDPEILSPNIHKYTDNTGGQFNIDINTGNFNLKKQIATPSAEATSQIKDQPLLAQQFKDFLEDKGLLPENLNKGRISVSYPTATISAQIESAIISLWQDDIDNYKIVTEKFDLGLIEAQVIGSANLLLNYLKLDYTYWPVDLNTSAVYPIKSAEEAYSELKSGGGAVIVAAKGSQASISSVYLAYYLSKEYPEYLQPVYVFEGENFVAFVQAVKNEYKQI